MRQFQNILSLYSEILILLVGATLLGWFIGYMMQRTRGRRKLKSARKSWHRRYSSLEDSSRADVENLEEQLQSIAQEAKSLQSTNRVLTDSLKKNDANIQKARAEAIELNRQHAETQERLQRIIQQKDQEIVELGHRLNKGLDTDSSAGDISSRTASNDVNDNDLNYADTVAINPGLIPTESLDATIQMSIQERQSNASQGFKPQTPGTASNTSDAGMNDTAELDGLGFEDPEEPTVALDDEALAFAQRSYPARRRD
jgi:myosin heavy subunit